MKTTDWIPGGQKPVRVGVYQRKVNFHSGGHLSTFGYSKWAGDKWSMVWSSAGMAERTDYTSIFQSLPWRGLTTKDGK